MLGDVVGHSGDDGANVVVACGLTMALALAPLLIVQGSKRLQSLREKLYFEEDEDEEDDHTTEELDVEEEEESHPWRRIRLFSYLATLTQSVAKYVARARRGRGFQREVSRQRRRRRRKDDRDDDDDVDVDTHEIHLDNRGDELTGKETAAIANTSRFEEEKNKEEDEEYDFFCALEDEYDDEDTLLETVVSTEHNNNNNNHHPRLLRRSTTGGNRDETELGSNSSSSSRVPLSRLAGSTIAAPIYRSSSSSRLTNIENNNSSRSSRPLTRSKQTEMEKQRVKNRRAAILLQPLIQPIDIVDGAINPSITITPAPTTATSTRSLDTNNENVSPHHINQLKDKPSQTTTSTSSSLLAAPTPEFEIIKPYFLMGRKRSKGYQLYLDDKSTGSDHQKLFIVNESGYVEVTAPLQSEKRKKSNKALDPYHQVGGAESTNGKEEDDDVGDDNDDDKKEAVTNNGYKSDEDVEDLYALHDSRLYLDSYINAMNSADYREFERTIEESMKQKTARMQAGEVKFYQN